MAILDPRLLPLIEVLAELGMDWSGCMIVSLRSASTAR